MLYWFFDEIIPILLLLFLFYFILFHFNFFLFMVYTIGEYVTDVIVTWSAVTDQIEYYWPGIKPMCFMLVLMLLTNWVAGGHLTDVVGYVY